MGLNKFIIDEFYDFYSRFLYWETKIENFCENFKYFVACGRWGWWRNKININLREYVHAKNKIKLLVKNLKKSCMQIKLKKIKFRVNAL